MSWTLEPKPRIDVVFEDHFVVIANGSADRAELIEFGGLGMPPECQLAPPKRIAFEVVVFCVMHHSLQFDGFHATTCKRWTD